MPYVSSVMLSGSGPLCTPVSSASMAASSSAVRSVSKTSKFSAIRAGLNDFGIAERPAAHAVLRVELRQLRLLEGVQLDLVDRLHDHRLLQQAAEHVGHEVAHADCADLAVGVQLFERVGCYFEKYFVMTAAGVERHSISMPAAVSADVRARVGWRGFSFYVTAAVERQLQRDALDELLARMEAEHGAIDESQVERIMGRLA